MDATVTARVPVEIRNQVHAALRKNGHTPTELINRAYQAYLATGELPDGRPARTAEYSAQQRADFARFLERTSIDAPASWANASYKELRDQAMRERFSEYLEE